MGFLYRPNNSSRIFIFNTLLLSSNFITIMKPICIIAILFFAFQFNSCRFENTASKKSESANPRTQQAVLDSLFPQIVMRKDTNKVGMVWIPSGTFMMGADNNQAAQDEYPKHAVQLNGFWMDVTEVTNAQFQKFVEATHYVTIAERVPTWEDMKKQLPPDTPKPPDSVFVAGSLVFQKAENEVSLNDYGQWWVFLKGANWRHPQGEKSNLKGKEQYPVVHIAWEDAMAYCKWAGKRLPTEAEWEYAARGGRQGQIFPWGNEPVDSGSPKANSWQGKFPYLNLKKDGFEGLAPTKSFAPNDYGLYDMAGNVWEWCFDWYHPDYYKNDNGKIANNPQGPLSSFDPDEPFMPKKVVRGGSFLCNDAYCSGYRVARRMKSSMDTGLEHTGFRCVTNTF
jgi:formylglycine-generating enzyme